MTSFPAVVGIADHYAWAIFVTIAAAEGTPVVVDRRRVTTLDEGLPNAPYHHEALEMDLTEADVLVERVKQSAKVRSQEALRKLREALKPECALKCVTLRAEPSFAMPETLAEILASHRALYAADGELYRRALCEGAAALGLDLRPHPRKPVFERELEEFVAAMGRELGPPWRIDHRKAAAAAIEALAHYTEVRLA